MLLEMSAKYPAISLTSLILCHLCLRYACAYVLKPHEKYLQCYEGLDYGFKSRPCPAYANACYKLDLYKIDFRTEYYTNFDFAQQEKR